MNLLKKIIRLFRTKFYLITVKIQTEANEVYMTLTITCEDGFFNKLKLDKFIVKMFHKYYPELEVKSPPTIMFCMQISAREFNYYNAQPKQK